MHRSNAFIERDTSQTTLASLTYYPAYAHKAHALNGDWIKIPASFIKKLHVPAGWGASHPGIGISGATPSNSKDAFPLFHYLNHPLPFVQCCGVVVEFDYMDKIKSWIFKLDDSSGDLLTVLMKKDIETDFSERNKSVHQTSAELLAATETNQVLAVPQWKGCPWLSTGLLDSRLVKVGNVVRVKGRISPHRQGLQLLLEKFDVFNRTSDEIGFWKSMTDDFEQFLKNPWNLTSEEIQALESDFAREEKERRRHARKLERQKRKRAQYETGLDGAAESDGIQREAKMDGRGNKSKYRENVKQNIEALDAVTEVTAPLKNHSLANHPVKAGLAPSYQPPKANTKSTTNSSSNRDKLLDGAEQVPLIEERLDNVHIHNGKCTINAAHVSKRTSRNGSTSSPNQISGQLTMVDMGSPARWKYLRFDNGSEATHVATGTAWIDVRKNLLPEASLGSVSISKTAEGKQRASESTIEQEWNELDL